MGKSGVEAGARRADSGLPGPQESAEIAIRWREARRGWLSVGCGKAFQTNCYSYSRFAYGEVKGKLPRRFGFGAFTSSSEVVGVLSLLLFRVRHHHTLCLLGHIISLLLHSSGLARPLGRRLSRVQTGGVKFVSSSYIFISLNSRHCALVDGYTSNGTHWVCKKYSGDLKYQGMCSKIYIGAGAGRKAKPR